jgi:peptide/nickel transport system ATP-binding protein
MYLGRIVEVGPVNEVLLQPRHPYARALISVLPGCGGDNTGKVLTGQPPDPTAIPPGCRFHPRCPRLAALPAGDVRAELCRGKPVPVLPAMGEEGAGTNLVACHLAAPEQAPVTEPGLPYSQGAR